MLLKNSLMSLLYIRASKWYLFRMGWLEMHRVSEDSRLYELTALLVKRDLVVSRYLNKSSFLYLLATLWPVNEKQPR